MSAARIWGATGLGLVALFVALALWNPATAGGPDLCLFHRATGLACPACGLTRAASALAHGELAESLRWHPLGAALAAEAALLWFAWGAALRERPHELAPERTRFARLQRLASRCALASAALLLLVWLVRLATGTLPA